MRYYRPYLLALAAAAVLLCVVLVADVGTVRWLGTFGSRLGRLETGRLSPEVSTSSARPVSIQSSPIVTVQVGDFTLHIPKAYIDSGDGFQGKFGYLKIKAELPCLTPLTVEDPSIKGHGWGNVVVAQLSAYGPSDRTGDVLLKVFLDSYKQYGTTHVNKDREADRVLVSGTDFEFFEDDLLENDFFRYHKNSKYLLIQCSRHSVFPSPACFSRSIVHGGLLLDYHYGRTFIDGSLDQSLVIDQGLHKLFDMFLSSELRDRVSTQGVC